MEKHPTANYKTERIGRETVCHFYCDLSGALVCTVKADDPRSAWESGGREHFSFCRRCGRWICDTMYNPDTLQCVDCSPWEEQPAFCPQCGAKVHEGEIFCGRCHVRLRYA